MISEELQISISTVYRAIKTLRDRFGFKVKCSRGGYQVVKVAKFPTRFYGV
jgi:biotin operon repressor